jgi:hypothetical protein
MSSYITSTKILAAFLISLTIIISISLIENGNHSTNKIIEIVWGISGSLIHCLLFYGAHKKIKVALIVWIVLACLELIIPTYFLVSLLNLIHEKSEKYWNATNGTKIFDVILLLADILLQISTIVIVTKAKKKIDEEERGGIFIRLY